MGTRQCGDHFTKRDAVPDYHDVHVADWGFLARRVRAVDEREADTGGEGRERGANDLSHTEGLADEAAQLLENRRPAVGLKVGLAAFGGAREESGRAETGEFPLDGTGSESQPLDDLALVEAAVRVAEQQPEDGLAGCPEEG